MTEYHNYLERSAKLSESVRNGTGCQTVLAAAQDNARETIYLVLHLPFGELHDYMIEKEIVCEYRKIFNILLDLPLADWVPQTTNEAELLIRFLHEMHDYRSVLNGTERFVFCDKDLMERIMFAVIRSPAIPVDQDVRGFVTLDGLYTRYPALFQRREAETFVRKVDLDLNTALWGDKRFNLLLGLGGRDFSWSVLYKLASEEEYGACAAHASILYFQHNVVWMDKYLQFRQAELEAMAMLQAHIDYLKRTVSEFQLFREKSEKLFCFTPTVCSAQQEITEYTAGRMATHTKSLEKAKQCWLVWGQLPNRMTHEFHEHAIVLLQAGMPVLCIKKILRHNHRYLFKSFGTGRLEDLLVRTQSVMKHIRLARTDEQAKKRLRTHDPDCE